MSKEWMSDDPCDVCGCGPKRDPQAFDGCEVFK